MERTKSDPFLRKCHAKYSIVRRRRGNNGSVSIIPTNSPQRLVRLAAAGDAVQTTFMVPSCSLEFGTTLAVVGDHEALGQWEVHSGHPLEWKENDVWSSSSPVSITAGTSITFKLIKRANEDYVEWEEGGNREIVVPEEAREVIIQCHYGDPSMTSIEIGEETAETGTEEENTKKTQKRRRHRGGRDGEKGMGKAKGKGRGKGKKDDVIDVTPETDLSDSDDRLEEPERQIEQRLYEVSTEIPQGFEDIVSQVHVEADGSMLIRFESQASEIDSTRLAGEEES